MIAEQFAGQAGVQSVHDQSEFLDRLFSLLNGIRNATIVVALIQALAALLLISNMVQVAAFTRRTETEIMRLVGASRWRTQLPFMMEAVIAGVVGAALAIGGLIAAKFLFVDKALGPVIRCRDHARDRRRHARLGVADPAGHRRRAGRGVGLRDPAAVRPDCSRAGQAISRNRLGPTDYCARAMATDTAPTRATRSSNRPAGRQIIASNRKARHDYSILDTFEAGISLTGTEVKSLRAGRASLVDGFATICDDEIWLRGVHIAEYAEGTWTNHAPRRPRKLLMHRQEIDRLAGKLREGGLALVPLSLYFTDGRVKVELGLARGKKEYDKRQTMAKRDADREIERYAGRRPRA